MKVLIYNLKRQVSIQSFWIRLRLLLLFCCICPTAKADLARQHQSYDRMLLPGGKAAMLGGAYTALSEDPSGLLYNPAGSAMIKQNQLSLNTWSTFKSDVVFKEAINGEDFNEQSNTRFGGFAGGLFKRNALTLGYVITTLDKRNINQEDYFRDISAEEGLTNNFTRIHQESNSYDIFGVSLAVAINKNWSIGLATFYFDRSIEAMDYQQVEYNGGEVLVQESKVRVNNQGIHGITGLLYQGETWNLGLSLRLGEALVNKGSLNFNSVTHPTSTGKPVIVNYSNNEYDDDAEIIPALYRMGIAWHPNAHFLISTDASYLALTKVSNGSPDRLATWNYAVGLETGWSNWRLMLGAFTNYTNFPKLIPDSINQSAHLNYIGKTIGSAIISKSFDLYVGFVQQDGRGNAQILSGSSEQQKIIASMQNILVSWNIKL